MRESRLGRWLVGGMLAITATAFVPTLTALDDWEWADIPPVVNPVVPDDNGGAVDDTREERFAPSSWEWA